MSNHIIHKQQVIVNMPGMDNAFRYQNTLSNLFANGLTAAMEDVLDEIDELNTVIRIDKLKLDLGEVSADRFSTEFKEKLLQQLRQSLRSIQTKPEQTVTIIKTSSSLKDGFFHFILTGKLPWYIEVKKITDFEADIFDQWNKSDWIFVIEWLYKNSIIYEYVVERLAWQFSDEFLITLFTYAFAYKQIAEEECRILFADIKYIYDKFNIVQHKKYLVDLFSTLFNQTEPYSVNIFVAEVLLSAVKKHEKEPSILDMLRTSSLKYVKSDIVTTILKNIYFFYEKNISLHHITTKDVLFETAIESDWLERMNQLLLIKYTTSTQDSTSVDKTQNQLLNNQRLSEQKLSEQKPFKQKPKTHNEDEVLFADNCGLVLLHPFLPPFFEDLKLIDNEKFISEAEQKRAVLLLYYLGTGLTETAEFNLVLQKILCGYNSEESLPALIELSQHEIDESAKLLQSVINYWPPLKNTSVEGLQRTFLQRKGKLTATETGWQLTVEQKTVDILLGKLPWGFSTIKLPWMQEVLNVDWC